jgi:RHS repeat-associated protein
MRVRLALIVLASAFGPLTAQSVPTGSMNTPRYQHTATLLSSGSVLVTGGTLPNGTQTNTAEIYNPQTGAWRYTGISEQTSMTIPRAQHTAILLQDGRVLIAGGNDGSGEMNSAEIFDPVTETFAVASSMNEARTVFAAVLLNDGRVLVAGGYLGNGQNTSAEIYTPIPDSVAGTWLLSNNNATGGAAPAIAVLNDGRVLVTGGAYQNTVELFDPVTDVWVSLTPLIYPRWYQTASTLPSGQVLVAGGNNGSTPSYTAELYDVSANNGTGGSTLVPGALTIGGWGASVVLLANGNVFLAGGYVNSPCTSSTSSTQLYNPTTGTLSAQPSLTVPRSAFSTTLLASGAVLSAGGNDWECSTQNILDSAELWSNAVSTGTIKVNTNLSVATFTITGPATSLGSGETFVQSNAPPGTYTITFGAVTGLTTPPSQTYALTADGSISFSGTYYSTASLGSQGPTNPTGSVAEPVNSATGNYYTSHTDLQVPGKGLTFTLTRCYNSSDTYSGPLGAGWTHSYNIFLQQASGMAIVTEADGHQDIFARTTGGSYTAQTPGLFDTLQMNANGSFTLTRTNRTRFNFSSAGVLLSIVDRNGDTQTLTYSGANLVSITDSSGRAYALSYNESNQLVMLVDPLGRVLHYAYDSNGNLASFEDALGGATQYTYDAYHHMISATDPRGNQYLQNLYDAEGRVISQTNARGFRTTFAYNTPAGGTTTVTDPLGNVTQYVHDSSLRLIQLVNALGGSTAYVYNAINLVVSTTDALGRTQTFSYDGNGNLLNATDPTGKATLFAYDSKNDLTQVTDRLGRITRFSYDAKGNLLSVVDAAGNTSSFTYDSFGEVLTAKNARNFTTGFSYDAAGDLSRVTDALLGVVQMSYDTVGRLLSVKNQLGQTGTRSYDLDNRLISVIDPLGDTTKFAYDGNGNLTQLTDANGKATRYAYDTTNKLAHVTDANGGITSYGYNGNTDLTSVVDANGHTTNYAYDVLRRLAWSTDPLARQKHYSYDAVGNVTSTVDGNSKTNTFEYDVLNRLILMSLSDGKAVAYTYDAIGNRLTMTDWRGVTNYVYDVLNRALSVATPDRNTVGYGYDAVGDRTRVTYPDGHAVQYQYDALNRLSDATDWSNKSTNYAYDPVSNLIATVHPNGTSSLYTYDGASRLVGILNLSGLLPLSSFGYVLDKVGNRTSRISTSGGFDQYGYDSLYRLTSWTNTVGNVTKYSYDAVGNRLSLVVPSGTTNYQYDAADELLKAGTTTFTYDGNGSQITKTTGSVIIDYGWDALNRLISVVGGSVNTLYQFDGDGNRITQQIGTGSYRYVNDTDTALPVVLNENGPDGNIEYVQGLSLISATSNAFQSFYQFDGLGSVTSVTNQTGTVAANYAYDPWGQPMTPVLPPFGLDTLGAKNKYKFTGEALDPNDGLLFLRARLYDPSIGRLISRDPVTGDSRRPTSHNRYAYADLNPIRYADPTGLSAIDASSMISATSSSTGLPLPSIGQADTSVSTPSTLYVIPATEYCVVLDVTPPKPVGVFLDIFGLVGGALAPQTVPFGPVGFSAIPLGCSTNAPPKA